MIDRDGVALKNADGKLRYVPLIDVRDRETRKRWRITEIEAMRQKQPGWCHEQ
jgi:hypothetical protein